MNNRLAAYVLVFARLDNGCKSFDGILESAPKPTARIVSTELNSLSLQSIDLVFNVEVTNPYWLNLPLLDLAYTLSSGDGKLLQGSIKPSGALPAKDTRVIQLPVRLSFASLLTMLRGVTPGSVVPYKADLTLLVDAPLLGTLPLPLSSSGEVPLSAAPQVELASCRVGKLSLDQLTALVKLRVINTNQFSFDLKRLSVTFSLGGIDAGVSNLISSLDFPAGHAATIEVPLSFSPRTIGISLFTLLRGDQIASTISGAIDTDTGFGPLTLPFAHAGVASVSH